MSVTIINLYRVENGVKRISSHLVAQKLTLDMSPSFTWGPLFSPKGLMGPSIPKQGRGEIELHGVYNMHNNYYSCTWLKA